MGIIEQLMWPFLFDGISYHKVNKKIREQLFVCIVIEYEL